MNVTALLDTPARSPAPLDSSVGDGGTDSAFANVMSQYQGNGNKSLAPGVKGESAEAIDPGDTYLESMATEVQKRLAGVLGKGEFDVKGNDQWLEINLDAGVLFESGDASLGPLANDVLQEVIVMLGDAKNPVTVEGYTDNVPIATARYASNWELSAARAASVVRAFAGLGIDPDRLAAVGYGEQHPVATNATPEGRAHNRRVTIVVARNADAQRGLTTIGAERSKPLEIEWRDEKADPAAAPANPDAVQAVRLEGGGIRFTNEPPKQSPASNP
jgi:chemotaxis protein MotB